VNAPNRGSKGRRFESSQARHIYNPRKRPGEGGLFAEDRDGSKEFFLDVASRIKAV